jgi:hypothetical protein
LFVDLNWSMLLLLGILITITDSNKLERIQRKFSALCHNKFFQDMVHRYGTTSILGKLNSQTLHIRRSHLHPFF